MKKFVALLAFTAVGAACTEWAPTGPSSADPPSFNQSTAPGQHRLSGLDAEFVRIAQQAHGFGGMFYDAAGRLNVFMTGAAARTPQLRESVIETARASLQARGRFAPVAAEVTVLEGTRDYIELNTLRDRLNSALAEPGVVFTDIDETHNRLRVGVLAGSAPAQVQAMLERLGVPLDAVSIETAEPIVPFANLLDSHDPVGAGLQIWHYVPPSTAFICTLGFNVRFPAPNRGNRYLFTNSHCTAQQGAVTGTIFRQGPLALSTRTVAVEVADPPLFACATDVVCRWSDAALAVYAPDIEVRLGMIYQTTAFGTTDAGSTQTLVPGKAFAIVDEQDYPVGGEIVDKVGRTTGWTRGTVANTCVHVGVANTDPLVVMLCQDFVAGVSGAGDSGSPVFQPIVGRPNAARLYGILWGGATGVYVFSALENLREEFGPFETH